MKKWKCSICGYVYDTRSRNYQAPCKDYMLVVRNREELEQKRK